MAALGQHPAPVHQDDPVGGGDGGRPVGNYYRRLARPGFGQCPHHLQLAGGVDGRGGVVEDEDAGVGQQGPGQGDALALPAREREAALADHGLVAER